MTKATMPGLNAIGSAQVTVSTKQAGLRISLRCLLYAIESCYSEGSWVKISSSSLVDGESLSVSSIADESFLTFSNST